MKCIFKLKCSQTYYCALSMLRMAGYLQTDKLHPAALRTKL